MALFLLAFVLGIVPLFMVFQSYYKRSTHTNYWLAQCIYLSSCIIIITHIPNALSLVHEVWEIGWCIEIGRGIHQTKKLDKAGSTPYRIVWGWLTMPMARTYSCPNLGICWGVYGASSLWKWPLNCFSWLLLSPSCGRNSCLAVNNLNIHDKSTSMSSDYGTNEHIQGFRYQYSFSIYCQV